MTPGPSVTDFAGARRSAPSAILVWSIAAAGVVAGVLILLLTFTSDHVNEPGLQATLVNWIVLPTSSRARSCGGAVPTLGSVPSWSWPGSPCSCRHCRGPAASCFGLSDCCATSCPQCSSSMCSWHSRTVRLDATFERLLVGTGYLVAVGFSLARMLLGAFGPQNLLSLVDEPIHERLFEQVQLLTISGIALVAFVALISRPPQRLETPLAFPCRIGRLVCLGTTADRRSLRERGILGVGFEHLRRATFFVIGLAPVAYLIELGQVRLARRHGRGRSLGGAA